MQAIVNGARLHYETHGRPGQPALVILHGAPGIGDCRDRVRDCGALADAFHVLFYDARGSGRSEEAPPYTHEQWVADLDELTRQQGMERFALLGHSYGGIVAQEYALAHPERLTGLILADTTPMAIEHEETIARALAAELPGLDEASLRKLFEGRVDDNDELRTMWERLLPLYYDGPFDPALPKQRANDAHLHHATHNHAFSVENPRFDVRDRLGTIATPTLVLCGATDWITPLALSRDIAARVPHSRLEVFDNSGHLPMVEEPERFLAAVRGFLRG